MGRLKFAILAACLVVVVLGVPRARADARADAVVAALDVNCLTNSLTFETVNLLASHMHYRPIKELGGGGGAGPFAQVRSWMMPSSTGPLGLLAMQGNGKRGHFVGCGISAPDSDGDSVRAALVSTFKLGPNSAVTSPDGASQSTRWQPFRAGALVLIDADDAARSGHRIVIVSYESLEATRPRTEERSGSAREVPIWSGN